MRLILSAALLGLAAPLALAVDNPTTGGTKLGGDRKIRHCGRSCRSGRGREQHDNDKTLSVYGIVVGKNGPKFLQNTGDPKANPTYGFRGLGMMTATNAGVANLAVWLQRYVLDRPVIDHTGISGVYNFNLN